jgi:hypothetical protein
MSSISTDKPFDSSFDGSAPPTPAVIRAEPITDHVPVKLSVAEKNHYTWKTYFYLLFREYNLRDHVDGSIDLLDHRDPDWLTVDTTIIRWLFLTISPDIFKTVDREGDDARTVWTKINGLFTDNKLQRIVFLQRHTYINNKSKRVSPRFWGFHLLNYLLYYHR